MSTPTRIVATCPITGAKLVREQETGWSTEQDQDAEHAEVDVPDFDDASTLAIVTRTKVDRAAIRREVEYATRAQAAEAAEAAEALKDPANKEVVEAQIQEAIEAQMAQLEIGDYVVTTHSLANISPEGMKQVKKALKTLVPEWPK